MNATQNNTDWADRVKSVKGEFFQTREAAERYHRNVYENQGVIKVKNVIEVQHVVDNAQGSVLEVGTGTGRFAIPMHDKGCTVTGTDISPKMLEVAKEAAQGRNITWQTADVEALPFSDASFDTVSCMNVIIHLPQWKPAILEFKRVCKPNGRIIFDMCSGDITNYVNRNGIKYGANTKTHDDAAYFAEIPVKELTEFLESNGMTIERIIPHDFLNTNYMLEDLLKEAYEPFLERVKKDLVQSQSAFDFWCFIEQNIIKNLPTDCVLDYVVVAKNGTGGQNLCPKPLNAYAESLGAKQFLEQCLGNEYNAVISKGNQLLASDEALAFLVFMSQEVIHRMDKNFSLKEFLTEANYARVEAIIQRENSPVTRAKGIFKKIFSGSSKP